MSRLSGLRVLFAAFDPFPNRKGSGARIAREVSALARAGVEVELLTLAGASDTKLPPGVQLRPVRLREDNYLARALVFRAHVERAIRDLKPDWVHARGPFEAHAALDARRPLLFEVNGLPSIELRYHHPQVAADRDFLSRLVTLERAALLGARAWLTQSFTTARFLRRISGAPRSAAVIPNGVELAEHLPGPKSGEALRLVYAGALAPWQGLELTLPALRDLKDDPRWTLHVVGGGRKSWQARLRSSLRAFGLRERVVLHGALPRAEVAGLLAGADLALCPLRRDLRNRVQGCSPLKLFEYGAAEAAIVASPLPCLREIYGPREVAWCPPRRRALRETLRLLFEDPEQRRRLGAEARRAVIERHQQSTRSAALLRLYRELARASA